MLPDSTLGYNHRLDNCLIITCHIVEEVSMNQIPDQIAQYERFDSV